MFRSNGRHWYQMPGWWAVIVAILAIIVPVIIWWCSLERDFSVSIDSQTDRAYTPGSAQTVVSVENKNGFKHYKYEVTLRTEGVPQGIDVLFNPIGGSIPSYDSTVKINIAENVPEGDYDIKITGIGNEGTEHSCIYTLNVISSTTITTSTTTGTPAVTITQPEDGAIVPTEFTAKGTVENLPDYSSLWVCVHVPKGRYYPQSATHFNPPVAGIPGQEWYVTTRVGQEDTDFGDNFIIYAVLADEAATGAFSEYAQKAESTRDWPGMEELPTGSECYAKITVIKYEPDNT